MVICLFFFIPIYFLKYSTNAACNIKSSGTPSLNLQCNVLWRNNCIATVLALLFCTIAYCFASNEHYSGICVRVLDGDTVTIADEGQNLHRIRITGLDAPELGQPYGNQAKTELKELLLGKEVTIIPMGIDK